MQGFFPDDQTQSLETKFNQLRQTLDGQPFAGNIDELVSACCENNMIKRLSYEHKQKLCSYKLTDDTKVVLLTLGFGAYLCYGILFRKEPDCHITNMLKYGHISVNQADEQGRSILYWAVHFNNVAAVKAIYKFEPTIDVKARECAENSSNPDIKAVLGIVQSISAKKQ